MLLNRTKARLAVGAALIALSLVPLSTEAAPPQDGRDGAGGRAVAHYPGGPALRGRDAPSARLYRLALPSGEPTIGVTNEGNVFTVAIQSNTRVEVIRSKNNGETWEIVSPRFPGGRNAQLLSFDPYIWVDDAEGADRIFTIDLTVACAYLSFSDDEGQTWTTNPLACGRPVNDHQTLFSGPAKTSPTVGYPNIVYYCWNDVASSGCSKSLDGGITFASTGTPAYTGVDTPEGDPDFCGGLHGHGHVDSDGNVYLPKGHCGQPWLAISRDEGRTWEHAQVAKNGMPDHEASVATDAKGNIYYAYVARDRLPYLVVSKNGGRKWSKPIMIGSPGVNESNLPSLDVGGVGKVAVAYWGSENSPGQPFQDRTSEEYVKTTWNAYVTVTRNAFAARPLLYSATINKKSDPMKRRECGPGRCDTPIYDFIDVVVAPDGQVWSTWVDACTIACAEPKAQQDSGNEGVIGRLVGISLR